MKCPTDQTVLAITERSGIEIDYCPTCRGVWLDRGELDKLIASGDNSNNNNQSSGNNVMRNDDDDDNMSGGRHHNGRPPQRESFLGNLFDF